MRQRYRWVTEAAALLLLERKEPIYSPITSTVPISDELERLGYPTCDLGTPFWVKDYDLPFLHCCDTLIVLMLEGWEESLGLELDIATALELGITIEYLYPIMAGDRVRGFFTAPPDPRTAYIAAINKGLYE